MTQYHHAFHLGSHFLRAVSVVIGGIIATAIGSKTVLGDSTTIDITAVLVVAGIIGPAVWWLQGKLTHLEDGIADLNQRFDDLPCNQKKHAKDEDCADEAKARIVKP